MFCGSHNLRRASDKVVLLACGRWASSPKARAYRAPKASPVPTPLEWSRSVWSAGHSPALAWTLSMPLSGHRGRRVRILTRPPAVSSGWPPAPTPSRHSAAGEWRCPLTLAGYSSPGQFEYCPREPGQMVVTFLPAVGLCSKGEAAAVRRAGRAGRRR